MFGNTIDALQLFTAYKKGRLRGGLYNAIGFEQKKG